MLGMLSGVLQLAASGTIARASAINPSETQITLPDAIKWTTWSGAPPHGGEMATLYGGLDKPGPYLVLMKWYPGYMSAPHYYASDRLSLVMSGTWWVNSGADFDPDSTVPVPAGGFVRRVAGTPHYDGVKSSAKQPAVIALFGIAPVELKLVDPGQTKLAQDLGAISGPLHERPSARVAANQTQPSARTTAYRSGCAVIFHVLVCQTAQADRQPGKKTCLGVG